MINTPGSPLPKIWIGKDLQCQIVRATWFGTAFIDLGSSPADGACGTAMTRESPPKHTWAPAALVSLLSGTPRSAWTPGPPQVGPFSPSPGKQCVKARVFGGAQVRVDERDCYTAGANYYTTRIAARNLLTQQNFKVTYYHAAACHLKGSSTGHGAAGGNGIHCTHPSQPAVFASKSEGFINTDSNFVPAAAPAALFQWQERLALAARIGNTPFSGCTGCSASSQDDAIGISWFVGLLHGGPTVSRYLRSRFAG